MIINLHDLLTTFFIAPLPEDFFGCTKFVKANAFNLSPHQVDWLTSHKQGSAWILIKKQNNPTTTAELYLYKATQAIDLKMNGLKTEPKEVWKAPFEWEKVWGLICPI